LGKKLGNGANQVGSNIMPGKFKDPSGKVAVRPVSGGRAEKRSLRGCGDSN